MKYNRLPISTYRVQLSKEFSFLDAKKIVPYLYEMGITDLYVSPITQAVRGSTHGYNVVDPNSINIELGGREAFIELSDELIKYDMGLIVDFVPNHLGILCGENYMWQDVMEYGPHSSFIRFFDINWNSKSKKINGKVLVPLMGDYYGNMLENKYITLNYDFENGQFFINNYGNIYPIKPYSYKDILDVCFSKNMKI